jgi:hypothetical protein
MLIVRGFDPIAALPLMKPRPYRIQQVIMEVCGSSQKGWHYRHWKLPLMNLRTANSPGSA